MTQAIETLYSFIKIIMIPLAAIGVAFLCFGFFQSDKKAEEAFTRAKYCFVAIVCVFLLGSAIQIGTKFGKSYKWDPNNPGGIEIDVDWGGGDEGGEDE